MRSAGDYGAFYRDITGPLRRMPRGAKLLGTADDILTLTMYILYPLLLVMIAGAGVLQELSVKDTASVTMPFVLVPGVSFVMLTAVRKLLNRRRPYEDWDLDPLIPRDKTGCSMPSRHVFSSAVISMCVLHINVPAGVFMLLMSAATAVIRVLGGIHYPSDVAAGFVTGVISGSFLMIF